MAGWGPGQVAIAIAIAPTLESHAARIAPRFAMAGSITDAIRSWLVAKEMVSDRSAPEDSAAAMPLAVIGALPRRGRCAIPVLAITRMARSISTN